MKKSQNKKIKLEDLLEEASKLATTKNEINPQDLINDANQIFKFVDRFENLDYENSNLECLEEEIKGLEKNLMKKYKDYIPKEESEEDLDTKE